MTIRNRYGESGHPCLMPVSCGSQSDVKPSRSTQKSVSLYIDFVMLTSFWFTPTLSIELKSCLLFALSNVFPKLVVPVRVIVYFLQTQLLFLLGGWYFLQIQLSFLLGGWHLLLIVFFLKPLRVVFVIGFCIMFRIVAAGIL